MDGLKQHLTIVWILLLRFPDDLGELPLWNNQTTEATLSVHAGKHWHGSQTFDKSCWKQRGTQLCWQRDDAFSYEGG